jgi:hypothetical protein
MNDLSDLVVGDRFEVKIQIPLTLYMLMEWNDESWIDSQNLADAHRDFLLANHPSWESRIESSEYIVKEKNKAYIGFFHP